MPRAAVKLAYRRSKPVPSPASTDAARHDTPLRFGPDGRFELQPAERRLLVDGQPAALGARALDLLIVLAAQPDRLMSKGELLDRVWPGLVVEEANLQVQVSNLRKLIGGDVIATVPGRGYRFVASVRAADAAPETNPPPAPRLFGREADREQLETMLRAGAGCVTLVGTSGVGKTTLARVVAAGWPGRTAWVDLAGLSEGAQVTAALARALGTPLDEGAVAEQLPRALQGQDLLLVLDNAEHLVERCAELAALLRPPATVRLLVTSQLPLAVAGERVQRLEPLALSSEPGEHELADGAMALLVERIVAADQRFSVTAAALPLLRSICSQLDGLPLALEMAAARVPLLGLQGVHDALAQRFALLTRGRRDAAQRHRTLHCALDWSYRLLGADEQRLFRALGVFAGGFTLDLAVALMTDDAQQRWDLIDQLGVLVDRSLVVAGTQDPPRYRLLETMRAFALEQLNQAPARPDEEAAARRRHAGVMKALFSRYPLDDAAAKALCEAEMENVREAILWAQAHDLGLAAELAALAAPVGNFTAWRQESAHWLRALEARMDSPAGEALPAAVQAAWWTEFARTGSIRRDPRSALAARRGLALWDAAGDPRRALHAACVWVRSVCRPGPDLDRACDELQARVDALPALTLRERLQVNGALAVAATEREDLEAILERRLDEIELARQLGLEAVVDGAESNVVFVLIAMGRYDEAAERGRALVRRIDASPGSAKGNLPWVLQGLLTALVRLESLDEAQALVPRAWAACEQFGAPVVAPTVAWLAVLRGRFEAGALLIGHALAAFEAQEMGMDVHDRELLAQIRERAGEALGQAAYERLVGRGRALDGAAAVALASGDGAVAGA
ncbi:hypothetical protein CLD22_17050 [Rubrivivax gelatinosus]|nr:hypothetical protein [Rubrivivax gelatinosus]